jgi:large subunit ribosomal protein L2
MGKKIRVQRRGRGTSTFKANTHKRVAKAQYPPFPDERMVQGTIKKILHDPGRGSPLVQVTLDAGGSFHMVSPEGLYVGQHIDMGVDASVDIGNVLPVGRIPEGTMICNVELSPGDGGKLARSSGSHLSVVAHTPEGTIVRLPSKKARYLNNLCKATIGIVAGAGRVEKPFLKAGTRHHSMHAKGRVYPRTRGVAMVAAAHPYGSSKRGARKVTTVSRHAPPGRKVGLISARSTGKRKRR